jgi:protein gp37
VERAAKRIFVDSMSDLLHLNIPLEYIQQVFAIMNRAHWHQYKVLTNRADRLEELSAKLPGVRTSGWVSAAKTLDASSASSLRRTLAHLKSLSLEPLLDPLPS